MKNHTARDGYESYYIACDCQLLIVTSDTSTENEIQEVDSCSVNTTHQRDLDNFVNTLHSIIPSPSEFATNYTNPCWYMHLSVSQRIKKMLFSKHGDHSDQEVAYVMSKIFSKGNKIQQTRAAPEKLFCIPQVYFIGFPKSGSSQLYKMMISHPQVIGGVTKEPHWWTRFPFVDKFPENVFAIIRYLIFYQGASRFIKNHPNALTIDASQSMIWDTRLISDLCIMPSLISNIVPGAKYIVIMRDPVSRLYSDFAFLCSGYWKHHDVDSVPKDYLKNAPRIFHKASESTVLEFMDCLEKSPLAVCTHQAIFGDEKGVHCGKLRLGISLYYVHVARWLKVIPRENFLFLRMEDLARDPYSLMQEVWQFLDLPMQSAQELGDVLYEHHNTNQLSHMKSLQMRNQTKKMLRDFFQPYNEELAKLLQDDRFLWTDV